MCTSSLNDRHCILLGSSEIHRPFSSLWNEVQRRQSSHLAMQVVDNSSAFRMQEGVPLVIPEVNPEAMSGMKAGKGGLIANPNCSTIIALMAVTPLHRAAGVKRMVVSTYQVHHRTFAWQYKSSLHHSVKLRHSAKCGSEHIFQP